MPDWVVREFSRPAILFQEQKCFLLSKERLRGHFRWKYSLRAWPQDYRQPPPYTIIYSHAYVCARERDHVQRLATASTSSLLRPFYPVLGFLWSGTKDRLAYLGFPARSITSASVALQFGAFIVLGIFTAYLGYWTLRNLIILAALGLDLIMRYDAVLRDDERQLAFSNGVSGAERTLTAARGT